VNLRGLRVGEVDPRNHYHYLLRRASSTARRFETGLGIDIIDEEIEKHGGWPIKQGKVMKINVPNINDLLAKMMHIKFSFDGDQKTLNEWLQEHREIIKNNHNLLIRRSDENDIKILISMLRDLLIRATKGERGNRIYEELHKQIKEKGDLTEKCYKKVLINASYRWGVETGVKIISNVVDLFSIKLRWNWKKYFDDAERYKETNFQQDELLKIKNIGFKVRDLALSSFNCHYVANDLHVVRVMTRSEEHTSELQSLS
jgi:hypothetical protein